MPSTSKKQAKLMAAVAHGWTPPGLTKPPVPRKVAKEFNAADKRSGILRGKNHGRGR